jgi:hypothetical protein
MSLPLKRRLTLDAIARVTRIGRAERKGLHYCAGKKTWSQAHLNWLASQKFEYPEHRLVFEEMMMAMRQAHEQAAPPRRWQAADGRIF